MSQNMTEEYSYELKIPKERIAVLIGQKGDIKKEIEDETHCRINIDSKEGDVIITGEDTLGMFTAREMIKAIARGFSPEYAKLLLKQDHVLEIISIQDYAGKSKNKSIRLKGRVIGAEGKSRRLVEEMTETYISVYGKTISILGRPENVTTARKAVESLLAGSPHSSVYKWLEKKRRELTIRRGEEKGIQLKDTEKT
jgi:ribosomal RNA assembly protein